MVRQNNLSCKAWQNFLSSCFVFHSIIPSSCFIVQGELQTVSFGKAHLAQEGMVMQKTLAPWLEHLKGSVASPKLSVEFRSRACCKMFDIKLYDLNLHSSLCLGKQLQFICLVIVNSCILAVVLSWSRWDLERTSVILICGNAIWFNTNIGLLYCGGEIGLF